MKGDLYTRRVGIAKDRQEERYWKLFIPRRARPTWNSNQCIYRDHADPSAADIAYAGTTTTTSGIGAGGAEEAKREGRRGSMGGMGRNNRAVYKPPVRRSVFRLCIKMTDNSRSYAGRLESSRCGDNDASLRARCAGLHVIRAAQTLTLLLPTWRGSRTCRRASCRSWRALAFKCILPSAASAQIFDRIQSICRRKC